MTTEKNFWFYLSLVLTAVVVFSIAVFFYFSVNNIDLGEKNKNEYKAVFLTNGQVYFGKIDKNSRDMVHLTDIYYLQMKESLQNQDDLDSANNSDLSLIKLGNELHGPEDDMFIVKSNILFIEILSEKSKVMKAIKDYNGRS